MGLLGSEDERVRMGGVRLLQCLVRPAISDLPQRDAIMMPSDICASRTDVWAEPRRAGARDAGPGGGEHSCARAHGRAGRGATDSDAPACGLQVAPQGRVERSKSRRGHSSLLLGVFSMALLLRDLPARCVL
eukprot:1750441-Rhodomonas_salina.1